MLNSEKLRRVALVRTEVSEERSASIFRVTRIGELQTVVAITSNLLNLLSHIISAQFSSVANVVSSSSILLTVMMESLHSSETSVFTRVTRRYISEGGILHRLYFL
jgi:hypothetical protein